MSRLTQRIEDHAIPRPDIRNNGYKRCIDKLAYYEDLEEQGRLIELPCAVGDEVFIIWGPRYRAGRSVYGINTGKFRLSDIQNLNNTVFTTREAAEAKLAEMEGAE